MQNLSDDELDNLFKKAADDLKPAFNASHWDELNAKLDQPSAPQAGNKNWIGGIVILLLITGGIGTYMWTASSTHTINTGQQRADMINNNSLTTVDENSSVASSEDGSSAESRSISESKNERNEQLSLNNEVSPTTVIHDNIDKSNNTVSGEPLTQRNTASKSDNAISSENDRIKSTHTSSVESEKRNINRNDQSALMPDRKSHDVIPATQAIENNALSSVHKNLRTADDKNAESLAIAPKSLNEEKQEHVNKNKNESEAKQNEIIDQKNNILEQTDVSVGVLRNKVGDSNENQEALQGQSIQEGKGQVNTTETQAVASDLQKDSLQEQSAKKEADAIAENQEKPGNEETRQNSVPKLSVKLSLSPDFSAVKYSGYGKPGSNYGIFLEYRMFPRLTVNAGAIWSRKIYTADDIEYNGHKIDETDGDCRILDIPINLNYHFKSSRSLSLFAGIGVSSYLMNREEYEFTTIGSYGDAYSYKREFKGKNNEFFSVLNVSIGIQKQVTSRMAIQLEPFVKQPIKGIGEGDLSLSSVGAFLNLKYAVIK